MGSYEILQMVREYICPSRRLDVGSGTAALFWILATYGDIRTTAVDVESEALFVRKEFLASTDPLPPYYYQAAGLFGHPAEHVESLRRSIDSYLVFNALNPWPPELAAAGHDSITAFGCFAISGSEPSYRACFQRALLAVRSGGRLVGADWIRHTHLRERDYSFVNVPNLRGIGEALWLRMLHREAVAIRSHETYSDVVLCRTCCRYSKLPTGPDSAVGRFRGRVLRAFLVLARLAACIACSAYRCPVIIRALTWSSRSARRPAAAAAGRRPPSSFTITSGSGITP